ncbi:DNA polymerase III subunit gamma/tau [Bacteroidia bacterium]|nr:DNA polymerase III subunit gamma/tau [Bacteroidia bacterium]GHT26477.1 DNA polymerase III subunit gamma/tau [Bacteroidia bacterium]
MDNYIVSARKYRPATFHSVVGQNALTTTLKNAILNNKLAHAYLFCGPRGVGKTTCARIFAKTINCFHPTSEGEACNECESCRSFNENRSLNIHELDAASNNSVDDIRVLTEQVRIMPQLGKYKVYIIDEVHMLSSAAFNAFLKTLEEPPHHAIFILATTEKHKILPTILSRCQIYDFNRIHINDIVGYLEYVAKQENVNAEREALNVIAQKADGGMRDALSIFDQVISFSQGNVTYKTVIDNLNVLDYDYYFRLTEAAIENKVSRNMLLLNEIMSKGFDGQQILSGLAVFFRDLLVCKDPQTIVLFETGDAVKNKYIELAARCDTAFLYKAIELTNETDLNYRLSKNKRLSIELLLIRLCQLNSPQQEDDKKKIIIEPISDEAAPVQKETQTKTVPEVPVSKPLPESDKKTDRPVSAGKTIVRIGLKDSAVKDENENAVKKELATVYNDSFTKEELIAAWKEYAYAADDVHLKNTMLYITPELKENNKVEITVLNPEQEHKFQEKNLEIKEFLFAQLKNNQIVLEVKINEDNSSQTPFTDKEKYNYMADKNPTLSKLVKEFNLRLD